MPTLIRCLIATACLGSAALAVSVAQAQPDEARPGTARARAALPTFSGFLCCNMRTDGSWISDINYVAPDKRVIEAGTPVVVTGYGRQRVHTTVDGTPQDLGNDYSRDLDLEAFARRYVQPTDPRLALARAPAAVRQAVRSQRVTPGMTREQVAMSLGWPVASETPRLDGRVWRYWLSSFEEFHVRFDADGRVSAIDGEAEVLQRVVLQR
ncbi:hypothetical protein CCO03_07010 [Comamonas serinivorans]|uniref:Outer membrane protein assembly factor BamE domain-containing protein n=1 Tax=Comamonas serinivorans TaxID=1082851 RepID=A0A1Y0ELY8_9BURK|nr:outer membrane protein assembly factor BamE [Comamonas serinivorans]ARU04461.1 hypothetical protein CCO03_07010 [Comamonas serinivorans]